MAAAGRLEGKVAVVTGAGQGIGAAVARRFGAEGAKVVVSELDRTTGARTVEQITGAGGDAVFVATDVGVKEQAQGAVATAVEAWGRVDVLVNNAWGGGTTKRFEWKTDEDLAHGFRVGQLSVFWTMQAAFPHMKAQGGGSIINVCSLNGVNAHVFTLEYNAAKEAVRTMTRTAAVEWGRHQIRCNVICPSAATEAYQQFKAHNPENAARLEAMNPMGRSGDPDLDVAPAFLFLASDDARYINGLTMFVNGGTHVNGVPWRPELPDDEPG